MNRPLQMRDMSRDAYWYECIQSSFDEHGIFATKEQMESVAGDCAGAHDNFSQAHYQPENPLIGELSATKRALTAEREKVHCKECNGRGSITENYYNRSSTSQCFKCHGEGRHAP